MTPLLGVAPARVVVDVDALASNIALLKKAATPADFLAVVKGDAYGHGLIPVAKVAQHCGVSWFGVAQLGEALALRRNGIEGRVLSWLHAPGSDFAAAIAADIDLGCPSVEELALIVAASRAVGKPARIHLKLDTGMARNGAYGPQWPALVDAAMAAERAGVVRVVGVFTHFVAADEPGNPETDAQLERFRAGVAQLEAAGAQLEVRHAANTAATLTRPDAHFDLVRPGIAMYGLAPSPQMGTSESFGLRPVMSVTANVTVTKRVPAGQGVSYGHTYRTETETTLADIPVGYVDGVSRAASNGAPVMVNGHRTQIVGRVCMDQFVVNMGDAPVAAGDEAVLFGRASDGTPGPSADEWAAHIGTINYEVISRMSTRLPRVYIGDLAKELGLDG